jgi:methylthioribose-1-phosphate isomerase
VAELRSGVWWRDDHLEVIDQTLLPDVVEIRNLTTAADVIDAIRSLAVRGAPAIGVCGAFGVALGLREGIELDRLVETVGTARPTGVNLARAVERVARAARKGTSPDAQHGLALDEALRIAEEDRESCRRIGEFGRAELASAQRLLTHCNTGRLATAGIGTALGIVYAKAEAGEEVDVLVTETRPVLQGARLTTWELADAGIPVTLISDPAAGAAISTGRVDAVVVGVDRVARNGDFANKIGTYALAVLARESRVPFYAAGPLTSFDADIRDGEHIVVEERDADEVRRLGDARIAPEVAVWNPAFDVTPARFVTAFITDAGVLRRRTRNRSRERSTTLR